MSISSSIFLISVRISSTRFFFSRRLFSIVSTLYIKNIILRLIFSVNLFINVTFNFGSPQTANKARIALIQISIWSFNQTILSKNLNKRKPEIRDKKILTIILKHLFTSFAFSYFTLKA